jgi:two-component system CheB/CheR fusion protein
MAKKAPAKGSAERAGKPALPEANPAPPVQEPEAAVPSAPQFPIVALGASAGGLEAFTAVLRSLSSDTGMGFVLIQHLDPKHESMLVDLLSKVTPMPVEQAREGVSVRPNRIYIIPPNTSMKIERNVLSLTVRPPGRGVQMPVDIFFRSLAEDLNDSAIAVVLSGTGSDGALGIEAVKGQGGITFAQDETAKHDGMPLAAAATGCVDFVLPPEGIARELARIAKHPYVRSEKEAAEEHSPAHDQRQPMARIFALLRAATSVDFSLYKHTTIRRRIARRMALHKMERLNEYVALLERNATELEILYREILIKVTSFFRDPDAFVALKAKVLPEIAARITPETPIRVWVPGCATGEEAYSIAMVVLEYLNERNLGSPVQVFATDISEEALEKARAGIYVENISLDVSPERLRRFFIKNNGGYQVKKTVRDVCVFARQNLAKDPPFSKLDLISCRNVLIYLEPALHKRIIPMFHYALRPHGYLMLGGSESIGTFTDLFEIADKGVRLFTKRQILNRPRFEFEAAGYIGGGAPIGGHNLRQRDEAPAPDLQKEADRLVLSEYGPPGVIINDEFEVVHFRGKTAPYLELAPGKASLNLLKMLREGLLLAVRNAVQKVKRDGERVRTERIPTRQPDGFRNVDLEVVQLQPSAQGRHFLVLFHETESAEAPSRKARRAKPVESEPEQMQQELLATRQYLQSIIEEQEATNEELQSANEEILSSNEELQSINQEVETAKEELQSTNEELTTVNEELQNTNAELSQINDDLNNLLSSVNIAIVMLSSDLRIRRFTPTAGRILNLIASDIGRPITGLSSSIYVPELGDLIAEVLDAVTPKEREVADAEGHRYSLAIRPYRTSDNRIDGAVMTLVDIESIRRGGDPTQTYREFIQKFIDTADDAMAVLDAGYQVQHANPAFRDLLRMGASDGRGFQLDANLRSLIQQAARGALGTSAIPVELPAGERRITIHTHTFPVAGGLEMLLLRIKAT